MCERRVKSRVAQLSAILLVANLFLLVTTSNFAQARYLPTRADESDVEVLKDLIKGLILQANMEQLEQKINRMQASPTDRYLYHVDQPVTFKVDRRSAELPIESANDMLLRNMRSTSGGSLDGEKIK